MPPRLLSNTGTIKVQLKRRLQHKSSALSLNVRPNKVTQATKQSNASTNELYREQGITFDQDWLSNFNSMLVMENCINTNTVVGKTNSVSSEDDWNEDEGIPGGVTDSMLTAPDFVDDSERQHIYNVASGEGQFPTDSRKRKNKSKTKCGRNARTAVH